MEEGPVEDLISVCLAKFAPRAKLGFNAVTCGTSRTLAVEVVAPAAKSVSGVTLHIQPSFSKGKQVPSVCLASNPAEPIQGSVLFPDGSDRLLLHIKYAPELEDPEGVHGAISLHSNVQGLLLKGELLVSGKAVPGRAPPVKPLNSARSSLMAPPRPGTFLKPAPKAPSLQPSARIPSTPAAATPRQAPRSAPLDICLNTPVSKEHDDADAHSPGSSNGTTSSTGNDTSAQHKDQSSAPKQLKKELGNGLQGRQPTKQPAHALPPKRTLSLRPGSQTAAMPPPAAPRRSTPGSSDGFTFEVATPRQPRGPPSIAPSASVFGTPSHKSTFSHSSSASKARLTPSRSPQVAVKMARSYLTVHSEGPLMKQERALTAWLNSRLVPQQCGGAAEEAQGSSGPVMTLQRLSAQAQGLMWRLYKRDPQVSQSLKIVYAKIDAGVFNLSETPLVMDVRTVQQMLEPLLSYHTFWLRAALVTVLRGDLIGDQLPQGGLQAAARKGVAVLIREGLLCEKEIQAASDKTTSWLEHRGLILKNFLLLVLLLDRLVANPDVKLPPGTPPLFNVRAAHKSSVEVARSFLHQRLTGMGDAIHYLERWGYRLTAVQVALDEYDYTVRNMKEDLRSGIRLAKLYEQLTGCHTLLHGKPPLWLHPVCDQHYQDNMSRVLAKFQLLGVLPPTGQRILTHAGPQVLRCRDVIDASRELTLGVLWRIALKWQVPQLVDQQALHTETRRMLRVLSTRLRRPAPEPLDIYPDNRCVSLLLKWAQAVCNLYALRIHNFTSSFGDGRALCYIVSTYLPELLSVQDIYQPDAPKPEDVAILIEGEEDVDMDTLRSKGWCAVYEAGGYMDDQGLLKSYKDGVRRNFSQMHAAVCQLGHVPEMLSPDDFLDGGLDEQSVILYVAHLAARLLEISREQRAAHVITAAFRKHLWEKRNGPEMQHQAAVVIQKHWRRHVACKLVGRMRQQQSEEQVAELAARRQAAATVIQRAWREHTARVAAAVKRVLQRHAELVAERNVMARRQAAICLQSSWRAHAARTAFTKLRSHVIRMQAVYRGCVQRNRFLQLRYATVLVQRWVRLRAQRLLRQRRETAASAIQQSWRRHQAQTRYLQQRKAACVIQAAWRGLAVRRHLALQRKSATLIQAQFRGWVASAAYQRQRTAAIRIQAAWRGAVVRKEVKQRHTAATRVQAAWRGSIVRKQVAQEHRAARRVQAAWRGTVVRKQMAQQHKAATLIQAHFKGWASKVAFQQQRSAAIQIQAAWRGVVARRHVAHQHRAAALIQAHFRGWAAKDAYQQQRRAAIQIQAAWRGAAVRRGVRRQHTAATRVQAAWKGAVVRKQLAHQHKAAKLVQAAWRGTVVRKQVAKEHKAARCVQAAWRGTAVRKYVAKQHRAAALIQAHFRGWAAKAAYQEQRTAVIQIQAAWRGTVVRRQLAQQHTAATRVQAAWRGTVVRKQVAQQHTAATRIQAHFRGWSDKVAYQQQRNSAIQIQAAWRRHDVLRAVAQQHKAATRIQACWKGATVRKQVLQQHEAATLIQAHFRGSTCKSAYCALKGAAVQLQSAWRSRQVMLQVAELRAQALVIQKHVRCHQARTAFVAIKSASISIQAAWRGHCVRKMVSQQQHAAILIQREWRGYVAAREYQQHRSAVVHCQAAVRAYLARNRLQACQAAAVVIQAAWRARAAQDMYTEMLAARTIQAACRGFLVRRALGKQHAAATRIQASWRRHTCQLQHAEAVQAVTHLQAHVRCWNARQHFVACRHAAEKMQAAWRGHAVRCRLQRQHKAATRIQAQWRAFNQRMQFLKLQQQAIVMQAMIRGQIHRHAHDQQMQAAQCVQNLWRRASALQVVAALREQQYRAASALQALVRGWQARRAAQQRLARIVQVQTLVRRWLAVRDVRHRRYMKRVVQEFENTARQFVASTRAAYLIQAFWKGYCVRKITQPHLDAAKQLRRERRAVAVIEHAYQAHRIRQRFLQNRAALVTITAHIPHMRAWLQRVREQRYQHHLEQAALLVQACVRGWRVRQQTSHILRGVTRIQAVWRGWHHRQLDGKQKAEMRRKLAAAAEQTARNPHKTLGARVRDALDQLLSRRDPAQLSMAINAMATGTRYSLACCQLIAREEGAAALLRLVRILNRSKPHTDLLLGVLSVLHNICRHSALTPLVLAAPDVIVILSERLQFFRDCEEVFMPTIQLVSLLVAVPGAPLKVALMPGVIKQWEGIAQIILRRMEMERKYICRLEGQKGSDVSAKEATRKLLTASKQLEALQQIITAVSLAAEEAGIQIEHHNTVPHSMGNSSSLAPDTHAVPENLVPAAPASARTWQPKNILVRGVLKEVVHTSSVTQQQQQQAQANANANASNSAGAVGQLVIEVENAMLAEAEKRQGLPGGSPASRQGKLSSRLPTWTATGHQPAGPVSAMRHPVPHVHASGVPLQPTPPRGVRASREGGVPDA